MRKYLVQPKLYHKCTLEARERLKNVGEAFYHGEFMKANDFTSHGQTNWHIRRAVKLGFIVKVSKGLYMKTNV